LPFRSAIPSALSAGNPPLITTSSAFADERDQIALDAHFASGQFGTQAIDQKRERADVAALCCAQKMRLEPRFGAFEPVIESIRRAAGVISAALPRSVSLSAKVAN
jgi:hypothetical protein